MNNDNLPSQRRLRWSAGDLPQVGAHAPASPAEAANPTQFPEFGSAEVNDVTNTTPEAPAWHVVEGQVRVVFKAPDGQHDLALDDLQGDPLLHKLARALGLFPPPGALPIVSVASETTAPPDEEPLFPESTDVERVPQPAAMLSGVPMRVGGVLWPAGPLGLSAERVAHLIRATQTEKEFQNPNDPGLSRSRLQKLLAGVPQNRLIAGALMVWCDAAGVFTPPTTPQPFRTSRQFLTGLDLAEIAARLAATPHPTATDVALVFAGEA
jgi:hypothetical protein